MTPTEFIASLPEPRHSQIKEVYDFIKKNAPNLKPEMFGQFIGFGKYHYKYASGREGDWFLIGIGNMKSGISVYSCAVADSGTYVSELFKDRLKAHVGKSCIRYKKFEDIDFAVLKEVLDETLKVGPQAEMV